jgi:hypothetical protein
MVAEAGVAADVNIEGDVDSASIIWTDFALFNFVVVVELMLSSNASLSGTP